MYKHPFIFLAVLLCVGTALSQEKVHETLDKESPSPPMPVLRAVGTARVAYSTITDEVYSQSPLIYAYAEGDDRIELRVEFRSPGKKVVEPKTVDLIVLGTSVDRKYLDDVTVKFVIDSNRTIVARARELNEYPLGRNIRAVIRQTIRYKDFKTIAKSKHVRINVGPTMFDLGQANLAHFLDVIKTVD